MRPEQKLQAVVSQLSRAVDGPARVGLTYEPPRGALVFRLAPPSLHVVGDRPLAVEFRRLVTAGRSLPVRLPGQPWCFLAPR